MKGSPTSGIDSESQFGHLLGRQSSQDRNGASSVQHADLGHDVIDALPDGDEIEPCPKEPHAKGIDHWYHRSRRPIPRLWSSSRLEYRHRFDCSSSSLTAGYRLALVVISGCILLGSVLVPILLWTHEMPLEQRERTAENLQNPQAHRAPHPLTLAEANGPY